MESWPNMTLRRVLSIFFVLIPCFVTVSSGQEIFQPDPINDETFAGPSESYITSAPSANLTNEKVLTNTSSVTWDFSTPGQAKATAARPFGVEEDAEEPTLKMERQPIRQLGAKQARTVRHLAQVEEAGLNTGLTTTRLTGTCPVTTGSTQLAASQTPAFDLPQDGCVMLRYLVRVRNAGDYFDLGLQTENDADLNGGYDVESRITVIPAQANAGP